VLDESAPGSPRRGKGAGRFEGEQAAGIRVELTVRCDAYVARVTM